MGKKQHSKDRLYLTTTEWKHEWGGFKEKGVLPFKRLPFHCCGITFTPFEDPVCTDDGTVFDILNIVPYIQKYKRHPVTGQPLQLKDLTKLTFYKNSDGEFHCPVMNKVFTEHTHIVAIKTTGNVYCWEAVEELCIKPKNWKDLITDEPFTRKDIVHIQDPLNLQGRAIDAFDHVQKQLDIEPEAEEGEGPGGPTSLRNMSEDMKRVLGALQTGEAKEAFARGGGGKRLEAARMIADAKAKAAGGGAPKEAAAAAAAASGAAGSGSGAAAASGAAPGPSSVAAAAGGDWRLRAPERSQVPVFKPGATTWDTEDYINDAKARKVKAITESNNPDMSAVDAALAGKLTPKERYEAAGHVKYIEGAATLGQASSSFTSSSAAVVTKNQRQLTRLNRNPSKKGYVRLHTSLGDLNLELHCDMCPRTCENFIALCEMGYYDGAPFHRLIKNFMIQGGDPSGTGLGGDSIYGGPFQDELDSRLVHNGRGILSMANKGRDTQTSQFFITFKSCRHLDFKHTVFGRVVGGLEVLSAMEKVAVDEEDRPRQEVKITGASVFTNPYQELEDDEKKAEEAEARRKAREERLLDPNDPGNKRGKWFSNPSAQQDPLAALDSDLPASSGVGKYLKLGGGAPAAVAAPAGAAASEGAPAPPAAKKLKPSNQLSNFDAW